MSWFLLAWQRAPDLVLAIVIVIFNQSCERREQIISVRVCS